MGIAPLGELHDEIWVRGFAPLWGAGERSETEGVTPTPPAKAGHST